MGLPDDLKDWRAFPSGFELFTGEETGIIVAALLALAFVADRLGWLT